MDGKSREHIEPERNLARSGVLAIGRHHQVNRRCNQGEGEKQCDACEDNVFSK